MSTWCGWIEAILHCVVSQQTREQSSHKLKLGRGNLVLCCGLGSNPDIIWDLGGAIQSIMWAPCACIVYVLFCGVCWGNSLSFGLQLLILIFSDTLDNRGKAKAWSYTSSYCLMLELLFWYYDFFMDLIWKQYMIIRWLYEISFKNEKFCHDFWDVTIIPI